MSVSANSIVNFGPSVYSLVNSEAASLIMGDNSLLIVPPGFDPSTAFQKYSNSGILHIAGTTLAILNDQTVAGWGNINDPVNCQGTIDANAGRFINLNNGLTLSGTGNIDLGGGSLRTNDVNSSISAGSLSVGYHWVGEYGTGMFTQAAGRLSAYSEQIGYFGSGTFNQSGGTNTISSTNPYDGLLLGYGSGSSGTYNLSGTGELSSEYENIGWGALATFNHLAGSNTFRYLYLGCRPSSNGTYNLSGEGQLSGLPGSSIEVIGNLGSGVFNQSGGVNQVAFLTLGQESGSSGTYNLTGGTLICSQINKGNGNATFNFGGGTLKGPFYITIPIILTGIGGNAKIDIPNSAGQFNGSFSGAGGLDKQGSGILILCVTSTFTGAVNFNGGLIRAAALNNLGNGTSLNFNGGGLQFGAAFDPSVRTMTFQAGGATLDTQTYNITLGNPIGNSGSGGLTKLGTGKLTFNALNTYSGDTIIKGGTLEIAHGIGASGTSLIDVQSGTATFKTTPINKANLNISTASLATFEVVNGANVVGAISGSGITRVDTGASLTAASISQGTLTIGSGATVVIQAIPGGPLGDAITPVPEPNAVILLGAALVMMFYAWAKKVKS
jgi:fibronectin-binding autotransporter adhesin